MKRLLQILSSSLCILLLPFGLNALEFTKSIKPDNALINGVHLPERTIGIDLTSSFHIGFNLRRLHNLQPQDDQNIETSNYSYFPDTIVVYSLSQNPKKYTYFYTEAGDRLITTTRVLQNEVWVNLYFELCSYDQNNNQLSSVLKIWQNGAWVNESRWTYTYTTNHNALTAKSEYWNGSSWVNLNMFTYTYNTSDKMVAFLKENWMGGVWNNVSYELYTYDTFGNLMSGTSQHWESNVWTNFQQFTFTYDANNNRLSGIVKDWTAGAWVNSYSETYTYDVSNQPFLIVGKEWMNNTWVNDSMFIYAYNEYGFITLATAQYWLNGSWKNSLRSTYTQNFYGGLQSALIENWVSNAWVNLSMSTYSHDENGNTITADLYGWNGDTWVVNHDGNLELTYYNNILSDTFIGYHAKASYLSLITSIQDLTNESILSFTAVPNPSTGPITLLITTLEEANAELSIYSLAGIKVYTESLPWLTKGENRIDINTIDLSNGMYIAKLSTGSSTEKLLKIMISK